MRHRTPAFPSRPDHRRRRDSSAPISPPTCWRKPTPQSRCSTISPVPASSSIWRGSRPSMVRAVCASSEEMSATPRACIRRLGPPTKSIILPRPPRAPTFSRPAPRLRRQRHRHRQRARSRASLRRKPWCSSHLQARSTAPSIPFRRATAPAAWSRSIQLFAVSPKPRRVDFHCPYACTKSVADQYVRDYARLYDLPTVVFRIGCIAGPGQFGNQGQGWVAHFVYSALAGRPVADLWRRPAGSRRASCLRPGERRECGPCLHAGSRPERLSTSAAASTLGRSASKK